MTWDLVDPECELEPLETAYNNIGNCEWESVLDTMSWADTVIVHSAGTIEDASAKCYDTGIGPVYIAYPRPPLDTCYCLEEFVN
jgi:hypothetical protein